MDGGDSAMDLSIRNSSCSPVPIVRPIPRPPWSIVWYKNLWSLASSTCSQSGDEGNETPSTSSLAPLDCVPNSDTSSNYSQQFVPQSHHHHLFKLSERCNVESCISSEPAPCLEQCDRIYSTMTNEPESSCLRHDDDDEDNDSAQISVANSCTGETSCHYDHSDSLKSPKSDVSEALGQPQTTVILDIACCDGPVQFKRVSNPNFALTVEHNDSSPPQDPGLSAPKVKALEPLPETRRAPIHPDFGCRPGSSSPTVISLKTYLCIYCNQSFKSLFCYQKHKKRHLNPVSVDITTTTTNNSTSSRQRVGTGIVGSNNGSASGSKSVAGSVGTPPENTKAKTKDLNVQFFPCKKCGSKFPSYYFVHKHRKICH